MVIVLLWIVLASIVAFLVAWVNGANNAANAIGTAVGSKALTLKKALILTATFDFVGAILFGRFVSKTLLKGIVDIHAYTNPYIVMYGMFCALLATGLWVIAATWFKIPMSISQAIVGGVLGFGLATQGINVINWERIIIIVSSWFVVPLISIIVTILLYYAISFFLNRASVNSLPLIATSLYTAFLFIVLFLLILKNGGLNEVVYALGYSLSFACATGVLFYLLFKIKIPKASEEARNFTYKVLLIMAVATMAFSHGAHDVANSAGPLTGIMVIAFKHTIPYRIGIPYSILALCAAGISIGILMWGYSVVETIGEKITTLTTQSAFIAQFSASLIVLVITRLGIPTSTTGAIIGAVAGVGFARGIRNVNIKLLIKILIIWAIAAPIVALLAALFLRILLIIL